jgi:thymidylate synthase
MENPMNNADDKFLAFFKSSGTREFNLCYHRIVNQIRNSGILIENGRNGSTKRYPNNSVIWMIKNPWLALPILSTRKINFDCWATEFCWDWNGETNVSLLGKYAYLWKNWADKDGFYEYSYGRIWRDPSVGYNSNWGIDQINYVVQVITKAYLSNKITRRAQIITWDNDFCDLNGDMENTVPSCHPMLDFVTNPKNEFGQHKLDLVVTSRSQDLLVGFPGDVIRYTLLLGVMVDVIKNTIENEIGVSQILPFVSGDLIFQFSDLHVYTQHEEIHDVELEYLQFVEDIDASAYLVELPTKNASSCKLSPKNFNLYNYNPVGPVIKYGLIP